MSYWEDVTVPTVQLRILWQRTLIVPKCGGGKHTCDCKCFNCKGRECFCDIAEILERMS